MSIATDIIRGHTETIILSLLSNGDSYGYEINKNIALITNGEYELKEATLYCAFKRLSEAGLISTYWGDEATGARRRYYSITENGKERLLKLRDEWDSAKILLEKLINGGSNDGTEN